MLRTFAAGQDSLKIGRLLFTSDNGDFDFLEPRSLQPAMQVTLRETEPGVAVELARALKFMLQEVEDHDLSTRAQDLVSSIDRVGRCLGVMQGLAENHEIDALWIDGRGFEVAEAELEVFQSVLFSLVDPERDNPLRVVDSDHLLRLAGQ